MKVRLLAHELRLTGCRARLPFGFGATTLRRAPLCLARVDIEDERGERAVGFAADLLVPKWFDKDPAKSARENVADLLAAARAAGRVMERVGAVPRTPFELWRRTYEECTGGRDPDPTTGLVAGFGVALLERALLDAACRARSVAFARALREDLFGFAPERVHPDLARWRLGDRLPKRPRDSVHVRHTVGLEDDLGVDQARDDSLAADIRRAGTTYFKVKMRGDRALDLARLTDVAEVVANEVGDTARFTLDGNEQYTDLHELAGLLEDLGGSESGRMLRDGLLCVEQPLPRARTFDAACVAGLDDVTAFAPVMIDEADHGVDAFPRAFALGYRGVSAKCCKGVFRTLLNRGLCETFGDGAFQSAEDLTCLPVLSLQQDLAVVAALGFAHCERNGHHYFDGLAHLPADEARDALAAHPDLYRRGARGIELRIEDGRLALGSLDCPGFGYDVEIRDAARAPADDWQYAEA